VAGVEANALKRLTFTIVSATPATVQHVALLAFGCTIAVAAWQPLWAGSCALAGRSVSVKLDQRHIVAQIKEVPRDESESGAIKLSPAHRARSVTYFLPAGIVLDHLESSANVRLSVPFAASAGVTGVAWLCLLLGSTRRPRRGAPRLAEGGGGAASLRRSRRSSPVFAAELARRVGYVWAVRWAAGAGSVIATWFCVYTLPRVAAGMPYTDTQALHVAGAAVGVFMSTVLIAFD
jgi:hypothetical protein